MNTNFLKNIGKNCGNYIAKGVGITALGVTAYDAHVMGKIKADSYSASCDADAMTRTFNNTQYLSNPSMTTDAVKKELFRFEAESNFRNFVNSGIGYFTGVGSMLVRDSVLVAGSLMAIMTKGMTSKLSAIGLACYAGISFLKDGLGLGQHDPLNKDF